jgi:hypothetical protein
MLPRLKDTTYGKHRWDTFEPEVKETPVAEPETPSLPWNDEVEIDQPPED